MYFHHSRGYRFFVQIHTCNSVDDVLSASRAFVSWHFEIIMQLSQVYLLEKLSDYAKALLHLAILYIHEDRLQISGRGHVS